MSRCKNVEQIQWHQELIQVYAYIDFDAGVDNIDQPSQAQSLASATDASRMNERWIIFGSSSLGTRVGAIDMLAPATDRYNTIISAINLDVAIMYVVSMHNRWKITN